MYQLEGFDEKKQLWKFQSYPRSSSKIIQDQEGQGEGGVGGKLISLDR